MCKNKILEKLLAIILIFTLTFANFAFVTESLATSFVETLFGQKADTGHKNVEFEAYFGTEEEKETSVISDVNTEGAAISLKVDVQKGYLKDGKIELLETEEGAGLNFKIKDDFELPEMVQSLEENTLYLRQVNDSSAIHFSLPIQYENEEYINEEKLSKDVKVVFSGIYADDKGDETEVSREITLHVSWKDEREVKIDSQATKYIDFGSGVILQTNVKVDNQVENNSLPVKKSKLEIKVPTLDGTMPSNITVVPNSTAGTNGKTAGEVVFDDNNWSYDAETQMLTIQMENPKQLVQVVENEEDYLKEENEEILEEERYYSKSGTDEYFITYTYNDLKMPENATITSQINAELETMSGVEKDDYKNVVTAENTFEYALEGKTGDIVSFNIENETTEISKAYMYVNYNHNDKYEIEHKSKTILNIAYKDIVNHIYVQDVDNYYLDKAGNRISTEDMYYKQISLAKTDFDTILGADGQIQISDVQGNVLAIIDQNTAVNEEGNIVVPFENRYSKINIEMTKPIAEGNLVIYNDRMMTNATIDKETFKNIASMGTQKMMKADYEYVEGTVDVGTVESTTTLFDTTTKANLVMDRDSLSTLQANENVLFRIELNNAVDTSDIYGHSVFEIVLPEYVKTIDVTNANIVYGEGLSITAVEVVDKTIRVTIDGVQDGINSGVLTNGTNIELNANIQLDLYTPAKTEKIGLRYQNNDATSYEENGYTELPIIYSAPTGVVTVNSIANYNGEGTYTTSVKQGKKEELIDVYTDAKVATTEIVIMNNNRNVVSNVSILGRIPFAGVKDIVSGDDLGTTLDTRMVSGIVADERNMANFVVYYSSNAEATNDLQNAANGWTINPETLDNVKSYLIVPEDTNYEMPAAQVLRFTYNAEIPANLAHNEKIYGTVATYCTNQSEIATTDEVSAADLVGLTTGKGPELAITLDTNRDNIKEFEELETTIQVSNIGAETAKDVVVNMPIPAYTKFKKVTSETENITAEQIEQNLRIAIGEIEADKTVAVTVSLRVNEIQNEDNRNIQLVASATAKDYRAELTSNTKEVTVGEAEFTLEMYPYSTVTSADIQEVGKEIQVMIQVKNLLGTDQSNVVVTEQLDNSLEFLGANVWSDNFEKLDNTATYDEGTRTITWNIDSIKANSARTLSFNVKIGNLPEGMTKYDIPCMAQIDSESTTYYSNKFMISAGKAVITIVQSTNTTDTYVKEGNTIDYVFTIKNEGSIGVKKISLVDSIPEGLIVRNVKTVVNGMTTEQRLSAKDEAVINLSIMPKEEALVTVQAYAKDLKGVQEKTVTNVATLSANNIEAITTNSITHIIEADEKKVANEVESSSSSTNNGASNTNIAKTYKLTGIAWVDSNENGTREVEEEVLPTISVKLINSETGVITKSTTTDTNGTYTFSGVPNGKYLVLFDYDTIKYTVTAYQKADVAPNVNSDAITTQVEQNGKIRNAAITDVITVTNGSVSNIDIGFVLADTFDLKLDKTITKITTQTPKGTTTDNYDHETFTKTEIAGKYVSGSTVYIEYAITVTNVGDIAGYAKKIVDYLPEGMSFNSGMEANANWYTGTDGNLYTTALENIELTSGQSQEIKLVLTKQMTEDNTGRVNNLAEIYEDYNVYGVTDTNSTPANKAQGENDLGAADTIIGIKTGEVFIYVSVIITTILLGSVVIFIAYNRIIYRRKRGV